jgi:hypothetical protein
MGIRRWLQVAYCGGPFEGLVDRRYVDGFPDEAPESLVRMGADLYKIAEVDHWPDGELKEVVLEYVSERALVADEDIPEIDEPWAGEDSFDPEIIAGYAEGLSAAEIAAKYGLREAFVSERFAGLLDLAGVGTAQDLLRKSALVGVVLVGHDGKVMLPEDLVYPASL